MEHPAPTVSVIVPVYKQWALLERCLGALAKQSVDHHSMEILVVNNEPATAPPSTLVEEFPSVHWYGRDYNARLTSVGFEVEEVFREDSLSKDEIQRCAIGNAGKIPLARKPIAKAGTVPLLLDT